MKSFTGIFSDFVKALCIINVLNFILMTSKLLRFIRIF